MAKFGDEPHCAHSEDMRGLSVSEAGFAAGLGVWRSPAFVFFDLYGERRYVHQRPIFDAGAMINFARCMSDGPYAQSDVKRSLRGG